MIRPFFHRRARDTADTFMSQLPRAAAEKPAVLSAGGSAPPIANPSRERAIRERIESLAQLRRNVPQAIELTEGEKAAISLLPPDQALDIAIALRKKNIPINRQVISDVERFCDENLHAPLKKLDVGNMTDLFAADYGDFRGLFRIPNKNKRNARIIKAVERNSACVRDKSMYMLDGLLRFGVIPHTAFAVHKDANGKMLAGVVVEFCPGITGRKILCEDVDITDFPVGKELLAKRDLLQDGAFKEEQCALLGLDDFTFSEGGRVIASYQQSPLDLSDLIAKRGLIKLQILDYLAMQVDRYIRNYLLVTEKGSGKIKGVKGIDNDLSFEKRFKTIYLTHARFHRSPPTKMVGLPEVVDSEMYESILAVQPKDIDALYADLLRKEEILGVNLRLDMLQEHVRALPRSRVIDPANWQDVVFTDLARSYIARDMATPGLPLAPYPQTSVEHHLREIFDRCM